MSAPQEINSQVVRILQSQQAQNHFTQGDLHQVIDTLEKNGNLSNVVNSFIFSLMPQSQEALQQNKSQLNQFSMSIARSLISQIKPYLNQNLDQEKLSDLCETALLNFNRLDKSKYDLESANISENISSILQNHAKTLNMNKNLNINNTQTILATQSIDPSMESHRMQISGLTAGIIAKVAGQKTHFSKILKSPKATLPANVLSVIQEGAVEIVKNMKEGHDMSLEQSILLGKAIGKSIKQVIFNQGDNPSRDTIVNAASSAKVLAAALVKPELISSIASALKSSSKKSDKISTLRCTEKTFFR